jgi:hypothetical protein
MPYITRSPLQTYTAAVTQLENAIYELDQAHALLKDIGCHKIAGPIRRRSFDQVYLDAEAVLKAMTELHCDSCGRLVTEHENGDCEEWSS